MRAMYMYGGTQKAASSWMHAAIRSSGIDASPVKEWHYWDRAIRMSPEMGSVVRDFGGPLAPAAFAQSLEERQIRGAVSLASLPPRPLRDVWPAGRRALPRIVRAPTLIGSSTALEQWVAMMRLWTVGDFTPANAILGPQQWLEISSAIPSIHVIVGVRNPTTRFWSMIRMYRRLGRISRLPDPDEAVRIAGAPGVAERSRMSRTLLSLRSCLPADQVLVISFDEVHSDPQGALARLSRFLGSYVADPGARNVGSSEEMPEDVRNALDDHFRDEVGLLADALGREPMM